MKFHLLKLLALVFGYFVVRWFGEIYIICSQSGKQDFRNMFSLFQKILCWMWKKRERNMIVGYLYELCFWW